MNDPLGLFGEEQKSDDPLGLFEEAPKKKEAGWGTALKSALANTASAMDQAISLPAGALASVFSQEQGDQLFKEMDAREKARSKWANPDEEQLTLPQKIVTAPLSIPAVPGQAAQKGIDLIRRGENVRKAQAATTIDAALNAAGMGPMAAAKTFAGRAAIGAAGNLAFGAGSDAATQLLSDNPETKEAYNPYDPDRRLADAIGGGLFQGFFGERPSAKPTKAPANKALAALDAIAEKQKAPEANAPRAEPGSSAWQDAQLKLRAEMDARETKGPVNETAQMDLIDQPLQGRMVSPYEAVPGDWRVDENGIPIKADLSMDLQNMQNPLQRNLWGDELDPSFPRDPNKPLDMETGDIPGVERFSEPVNFRNDPENQRPLTEAIDSMEPAARTAALEQTQMGRELPASNELEVARAQAENTLFNKKDFDSYQKREQENARTFDEGLAQKARGEQIKRAAELADGPQPKGFNKAFSKQRGSVLIDGRQVTVEPTETGFVAKLGKKVVGYLNSNITPEQQRMLGEDASVDMVKVDDEVRGKGVGRALYEAWAKANDGNVIPSGKTSQAAWNTWKKSLPGGMDKFVNQEAQRILGGADPQHVLGNIPDPEVAQRVQARAALLKKQGGGVLFDWKKKSEVDQLSRIAGIKDKLKAFVPTEMDAAGTIELARQSKDVDQNLGQRFINQFTKGGLYQAEKTGNPIIKFTVDKVLNADRKARADVRDYIHDSLAPAMRNLSTEDMVEVATVLNHADKLQVPIDEAFLREQGFNDKQIAFANAHRLTMDKAFESINKARAAVGKDPIDKRVSYAAMAATGDFRKVVYKLNESGEKEVVGIIGANTRKGLGNIEQKLAGNDYVFGEERYARGSGKGGASDVQAMMSALEHLAETNPATKDFLDVLSDLKEQEAYNFVNVKKHTQQKKGVFGMEGRKQWQTDLENAKDFMDAQLKYAESAIRWGHLSDAASEIKQVMASDVNQPNAKKWAEGYFQNALGLNPSSIGRGFEKAMDNVYEVSGVGKTIPNTAMQYSRKITNTLLLGLNPAFLATNVIQPLMAMPAMNAFLKGRGLDENSLMTMGYDSMAQAGMTMMKQKMGKLSPLEEAAAKYAKDNHVFGTDLVDTSSVSRKNAEYYLDKSGNFLASNVESATRQMIYYGFVHMLDKNGMGKEFGLAQNLTDMAMNNYSPVDRPNIFNVMGPVGDMAANLSSFKHNELSRLAMFAREISKEKSATPLLVQLATGVAAAGITGTIGFAEADWLYRQISKALGAPDSLTNVVFKFSESMQDVTKHPYALSHGVFSYLGLDMSKRLGVSDVVPNSIGEALFPGGSKLLDVGSAGLSAAADPSEINLKRLAREAAPGIATGPMDRAWFSTDTPQGELAHNRRTLQGQVIRTEEDKTAKNLGFMGINESVQKQKLYDLAQQGIGYSDLRGAVVKKMAEQIYTKGEFDPKLIDNYIKYEGDLDTLTSELESKIKAQQISMVDAAKLRALVAKKIPQLKQGQRVLESFK